VKLDASVIKPLTGVPLAEKFFNVASTNTRDMHMKSYKSISAFFRVLDHNFRELPKINKIDPLILIQNIETGVDKIMEIILRKVFKYSSTYFEHETNYLYSLLKEEFQIPFQIPSQESVLKYQLLLVSELIKLVKFASPLLIKYSEITWNDDLQDKNLQRILEEAKQKTKLITLLEELKSEEGREKMLTSTRQKNRGNVLVEQRMEALEFKHKIRQNEPLFSEKGKSKDDGAKRPIAEKGDRTTKQYNSKIIETQKYYTQKNVEIPSHETNIFSEQTTVANSVTQQQDDDTKRPIAEKGDPTKHDNATLMDTHKYDLQKNIHISRNEMNIFRKATTGRNSANFQQIFPVFDNDSEVALTVTSDTNGNTKKNVQNSSEECSEQWFNYSCSYLWL
jgi:hypothetical protein